jgi:DNA-binding FadR family transcriptional regulator
LTEKPHRFRSIGSKRSFELVIREMQKAITREDLKPGQKLPAEPELAAQFGVSRSALREALKALELSGYLEVRRGYGGGTFVSAPEFEEFTVIAPPSVSSLEVTRRHLLEVRLAVEPQAARLAVSAPFEEILSLHEAIRHMESFDDRPAHVLAAAANFHISLSRASGNPVFVSVLEGLRPVMFRAMASLVKDSEWRETCRLQHETIVKEIEKGDADGAENAMRVHLSAKEGEGA